MISRRLILVLFAFSVVLAIGACGVMGDPLRAADDENDADVHAFLDTYFDSWSRADFTTYASLFHPRARITFMQDGRARGDWSKGEFIRLQKRVQSGTPSTERSLSRTVMRDAQGASVVTRYELVPHDRPIQRGVDRFTLVRDENQKWRIISLTFYLTP